MMASEHIISVSEADFEYQVIEFSKQMPVVVDFWAEWCGPCKTLGPILERITDEAKGAFRLAKVDVDQNPNLALRFNVRSIPSVKAFRDGQLVAEFVGLQPESRIREFLRNLAPSEHDLVLEKAISQLEQEQWEDAETSLREFLKKNPNNPAGLLGLARSLLAQGLVEEPARILSAFPASKEYNTAQVLHPLVKALTEFKDLPGYSENPLEAAYINALRLIKLGNFEAAMDGLLDILRQDKRYRDDGVRKVLLGLFEVLGPKNYLTRQYRNELALVLF
jgi:putative thioredoxin